MKRWTRARRPLVRRRQVSNARTSRRITMIAPEPGQFTEVAGDPARAAGVLAQARAAILSQDEGRAPDSLTDRKVRSFGVLDRF